MIRNILTRQQKSLLRRIYILECKGMWSHLRVDGEDHFNSMNCDYYSVHHIEKQRKQFIPHNSDLAFLRKHGFVSTTDYRLIKRGIEIFCTTQAGRMQLPDKVQSVGVVYSTEYLKTQKAADRQQHLSGYFDNRNDGYWGEGFRLTRNGRSVMCVSCFAINVPCDCSADTTTLDIRARPPKKIAGKQRWRDFLTQFAPNILKNINWWKDRNEAIK